MTAKVSGMKTCLSPLRSRFHYRRESKSPSVHRACRRYIETPFPLGNQSQKRLIVPLAVGARFQALIVGSFRARQRLRDFFPRNSAKSRRRRTEESRDSYHHSRLGSAVSADPTATFFAFPIALRMAGTKCRYLSDV